MLCWVVMSCSHVVTLPYDVIRDIIRHMLRVYKRVWRCAKGDSLVQPLSGKEVHVHA